MNNQEYSVTLRLPADEIKAIIEECTDAGCAIRLKDNSGGLSIRHPGGSSGKHHIFIVELSDRGLSFIHGSFLHTGSECSVVINGVDGEEIVLSGRVSSCSHIRGGVHQVGMQFDRPINVNAMFDPTQAGKSLSGKLLFIEQSAPERDLMTHVLRGTRIQVVGFSDIDSALSYLHKNSTDRVMSDLGIIENSMAKALQSIRREGYGGPILLTAADMRSPALRKATDLGMGPVLSKPFKYAELIGFLEENWVKEKEKDRKVEPPPSEIVSLVESYIDLVHLLVQDLDAATLRGDYDLVLRVCHRIKGSGVSFGFSDVTTAAASAITALIASGSLPEAKTQMNDLRQICKSLTPNQSSLLSAGRLAQSA